MNLKDILFSLNGRVSGIAFFAWHFIVLTLMLSAGVALSFVPINMQVAVNIVWLLLLWPSFCLGVKRLHDTGHSGKWLWVFVPEIVCALIAQLGIGFAGGVIAALFGLLAILSHLACWGLILYLTLKRSEAVENRYGMPV